MIVLTGNPPNPDHPEIAATTTGIQRQRTTEFVRTMVELGQRARATCGAQFARSPIWTRTTPPSSTAIGQRRHSNPDGSVAAGHQDYGITELRMVRTDAGWLVEDWYTGGDQRCEP